ncbi:peptidoglycan-binding domain-containing protein [Thiothrix subterranea]|uniref:Peptidoglycan-binding domain-containing protein n=1 Tax=Thiothrix subterranea TaxID=2735563 RepID=A0AA51MJK8_9GAMM|nr:peptidoglycan-binding domain-containing protein [Thiothrix subterranea]WML85413.1 peptidoglycan-binding domain-containing protein [Thiothrix subterranea]
MKIIYFPITLVVSTVFISTMITAEPARQDAVCQSQVLAPALFRPGTEAVTVYESSTRYHTTPVQMGYGERKVKIADAYVEYEIIPATFGEVTETIEVERERVEIETLPATYRTETKRIKVKAATQRWNSHCAAILIADNKPAENCLLTVPAEYTTVTREVIDSPARTVKRVIPARTETITRKVLLEPAKVVRKEIPAVYTSVKLAKIEQPATVSTTQQAAKTQNIPVQQTLRPEQIVSMPALCEASVSAETIQQLQHRLQQQGYYQGTPDGALGPKTRSALTQYQEAHGLASGAITLETLRKLQLQ